MGVNKELSSVKSTPDLTHPSNAKRRVTYQDYPKKILQYCYITTDNTVAIVSLDSMLRPRDCQKVEYIVNNFWNRLKIVNQHWWNESGDDFGMSLKFLT